MNKLQVIIEEGRCYFEEIAYFWDADRETILNEFDRLIANLTTQERSERKWYVHEYWLDKIITDPQVAYSMIVESDMEDLGYISDPDYTWQLSTVWAVRDREAGNTISRHLDRNAAVRAMGTYEADDLCDGTYVEDFYEVVRCEC